MMMRACFERQEQGQHSGRTRPGLLSPGGRILKTLGFLLFSVLFAGLANAGPAPVACAWTAVADASVRTGGAAVKASGHEPLLEIRSTAKEGTSEAYLRFDLSDAASIVDNAKLRIYAHVAEPGTARLLVRSVPGAKWEEQTITWTTKPDQEVTLGSVEVVGISAAWYELDISQHVKSEQAAGRSRLSFAFLMGGALENRILVCSREAPDHKPAITGTRPPFAAKIIFLPATSTPPTGYLPDNGLVFGPKGKGLQYGWDGDNTKLMRDRGNAGSGAGQPAKAEERAGQVLAYMDHQTRPKSAKWEMSLPNGTYRVKVRAGDPQSYDSVYAIDVEDVVVVDGIADKNRRWVDGVKEVRVQDGRLTVSGNPSGSKNKINFIEITEVAP
jgi:hypothetical protein